MKYWTPEHLLQWSRSLHQNPGLTPALEMSTNTKNNSPQLSNRHIVQTRRIIDTESAGPITESMIHQHITHVQKACF